MHAHARPADSTFSSGQGRCVRLLESSIGYVRCQLTQRRCKVEPLCHPWNILTGAAHVYAGRRGKTMQAGICRSERVDK